LPTACSCIPDIKKMKIQIDALDLMLLRIFADAFRAAHKSGSQKMFKELSIAIILTIIFSIGVGVLFVRTLVEMVELFFNGEIEKKEPAAARGKDQGNT